MNDGYVDSADARNRYMGPFTGMTKGIIAAVQKGMAPEFARRLCIATRKN